MSDDNMVNNGDDDGDDGNCFLFIKPTIPGQKRLTSTSTTAWKVRVFFIFPISDQAPAVSSY